jgi:outer membrane immunogenic protein
MKKLLLGAVALAALGGPVANAQNLAARPLVTPVGYTNWTGCHLGGTVGNSWGSSPGYTTTAQSTIPAAPGLTLNAGQPVTQNNLDMTGFTGGFYGGCDYQAGNWVIGFEADWSMNNNEGQANSVTSVGGIFFNPLNPIPIPVNVPIPLIPNPFVPRTPGANGDPGPVVYQMQERWYSTVRGRLGYAVDRWLLSISGGVALARIDSATYCLGSAPGTTNCTPNGVSLLQTDNRAGWTIGAALEYGVGYGWSVRTEYLYVNFPSWTTFTPGVANTNPSILPNFLSTKLYNNILRFGLTYKFGSYAAAAVTK